MFILKTYKRVNLNENSFFDGNYCVIKKKR